MRQHPHAHRGAEHWRARRCNTDAPAAIHGAFANVPCLAWAAGRAFGRLWECETYGNKTCCISRRSSKKSAATVPTMIVAVSARKKGKARRGLLSGPVDCVKRSIPFHTSKPTNKVIGSRAASAGTIMVREAASKALIRSRSNAARWPATSTAARVERWAACYQHAVAQQLPHDLCARNKTACRACRLHGKPLALF